MAYGERTVSGDQRIGSGDQQRNLNDQINLQEQRLEYFMNHYLPKQEVLYRLPLNISISSFWQELIERRKAGANLLPLHNSLGKPYWYMLTPKMIAASERLSREVIIQEKRVDPYQMKMTSAMTSEMYFTSYVEGAKISIEEAMNFLSRGTPPENVLEQLIWNNRQAWEWMIRNLYRPINEESLHFLAYTLTDGMENAAEEYRQTDYHLIPAMQDESYQVPPAARIPALMYEYYRFMNDQNVHPLIKTSVGAAFLLVTRPFPEGNERLSRMISSMVLLRSGYSFFCDISLSSVIAKETWQYYQNVCEIMREDNDGDLTYFLEYFLEMLVRALDQIQEQQLQRTRDQAEENLKQEQELSRQPLQSQSTAQSFQSTQENIELTTKNVAGPEQPLEHVAPSTTETLPIEKSVESGEEKNVASEESPPDPGGLPLVPDVEDPMWLLKLYNIISEKLNNRGGIFDITEERMAAVWWLKHLNTYKIPSDFKDRMVAFLNQESIFSFRMTAFLVFWMEKEGFQFSSRDYRRIMNATKNCTTRDLKEAKEAGLTKMLGGGRKYYYWIAINEDPSPNGVSSRSEDRSSRLVDKEKLSERQQEFLDMIQRQYGQQEFKIGNIRKDCNVTKNYAIYHADNLYKKGFLERQKIGSKYTYWLADQSESIQENTEITPVEKNAPDKTTMLEEQAERLRVRLEQKHSHINGVEQAAAVAG